MKVLGFYKKGARVIIEGSGGGVDRRRSFGGGGSADVEVGIVPAKNAKIVSDAAHDVIKHGGAEWLVLNAGHVYEIVLSVDGVEKSDVIDASSGHLVISLPKGSVVVSVGAYVPEQAASEV